jgi:hypothetical protein
MSDLHVGSVDERNNVTSFPGTELLFLISFTCHAIYCIGLKYHEMVHSVDNFH